MLKKVLFDEFVRLNRGFDLPDSKIVFGKYPVVASTNIKGYHNEYKVEPPVVVTGRSGSLGKVQYISEKCWPLNTSLYSKDFRGNNPYYVYLFLQTMHLEQYNAGVGVPTLNQNHLHGLRIYIHNKPDQQKIVDILSKYDRLIETNNKRIKVLEQMAEELYKEWFVRFRFPGYETAESENGIPKGWRIKRLSEFCYVTDGTHDTPIPTSEGIPLVTGKSIKDGFVDFSLTYNISEEDHKKIKKRSGLKTGDIIFSNIGTVGLTSIVDYDREFSVKNVIILKTDYDYKTTFLYYWLKSNSMQEIFSTQTNGSSQQFVGLTFMRRFKILVPSLDILRGFNESINPMLALRNKIHKCNQNLIKQRDLLLPRLMSGKLEV